MTQAKAKQTATETKQHEVLEQQAFAIPDAYKRGDRKLLQPFFSGDWWLNVDYVEYETNADSGAIAA